GVKEQKRMFLTGNDKITGQIEMRKHRRQVQRFCIITRKPFSVMRQERVEVKTKRFDNPAAQRYAPSPHMLDNAVFANRYAVSHLTQAARQMHHRVRGR